MMRATRPPESLLPSVYVPIVVPQENWSPEQRRFLQAAIASAQGMYEWWLDKEAKKLEDALKDD